MERQLQEIFRAVFELGPDERVSELQQVSYERWDSLAHVTLMAAIENEFEVAIDLDSSLELTSYNVILAFLEEQKA